MFFQAGRFPTPPVKHATLVKFRAVMESVLDRFVIDQTGLTDRFDFSLQRTPDETQFGRRAGKYPKLTSALQNLGFEIGLRESSRRGSRDRSRREAIEN
jgi:uncharacterized protein (TIGR03435 family)